MLFVLWLVRINGARFHYRRRVLRWSRCIALMKKINL
jgi:hypothetical protein